MDRDPHPIDTESLRQTYGTLVDLWTSGVRDYHSLLSDYLTANSIFVAAIGFILARQPPTFLFTFLGMILCVFGILMVLQMAIVLGRFSAQIALWEWQLQGTELHTNWHVQKPFRGASRQSEIFQRVPFRPEVHLSPLTTLTLCAVLSACTANTPFPPEVMEKISPTFHFEAWRDASPTNESGKSDAG